MSEIKYALGIFQKRWPEVSLIIGLLFLNRLLTFSIKIFPDIQILLYMMSLILYLFACLISLGFLRTVYLSENKRRSFTELIRTGKHFFWRFFILAILIGLAAYIFIHFCKIITSDAVTFQMLIFLFRLIFIKVILIIPAIILVTDCGIFQSFGLLKRIKLIKARELLFLFLVFNIAFEYLMLIFKPDFWLTKPSGSWAETIPVMMYYLFSCFINLLISIVAIRFVSYHKITRKQVVPVPSFHTESKQP